MDRVPPSAAALVESSPVLLDVSPTRQFVRNPLVCMGQTPSAPPKVAHFRIHLVARRPGGWVAVGSLGQPVVASQDSKTVLSIAIVWYRSGAKLVDGLRITADRGWIMSRIPCCRRSTKLRVSNWIVKHKKLSQSPTYITARIIGHTKRLLGGSESHGG